MAFIRPFINKRSANAVSNIESSVEEQTMEDQPEGLSDDNTQNNHEPSSSNYSLTGKIPHGGSQTHVTSSKKEIVTKKTTKRSYARMTQKDIDKVLDVKVLDYLSAGQKESKKKRQTIHQT